MYSVYYNSRIYLIRTFKVDALIPTGKECAAFRGSVKE